MDTARYELLVAEGHYEVRVRDVRTDEVHEFKGPRSLYDALGVLADWRVQDLREVVAADQQPEPAHKSGSGVPGAPHPSAEYVAQARERIARHEGGAGAPELDVDMPSSSHVVGGRKIRIDQASKDLRSKLMDPDWPGWKPPAEPAVKSAFADRPTTSGHYWRNGRWEDAEGRPAGEAAGYDTGQMLCPAGFPVRNDRGALRHADGSICGVVTTTGHGRS